MLDVRLEDETLIMRLGRDPGQLAIVRSLPVRKYDSATQTWRVAYVRENWKRLIEAGFSHYLRNIPEPTASAFRIDAHKGKYLAVHVPPTADNLQKCRGIPDGRTWQGEPVSAWVCRPSAANVSYLRKTFPQTEWSDEAKEIIAHVLQKEQEALDLAEDKKRLADVVRVTDYKFGGAFTPYKHQEAGFALSRDKESYALLMEQGTGKTRVIIDTAVWLAINGEINAVLIVCPNGVKDVWAEQVPEHSPDYLEHEVIVWRAGLNKADERRLAEARERGRLPWLVMNVEALSTKKGYEYATRFLATRAALMTVDESTRIKTPSAKRTKSAWKLGKIAKYRRILTGTPITTGPLDAYAQFRFLDDGILGFGSFYAFRNHFADMGGYNGKEVIAYKNLDELQRLIEPYSYRVLKEDCLDLPPKVYQKHYVEMTPEQDRLYRELQDQMRTELDGVEVSVTIVLTKLLRLQQVVGGFLPGENPGEITAIPGPNPKLRALLEIADDYPGKMIVWSRFRPEIGLIAQALRDKYGDDAVVEFHGGVDDAARKEARRLFQDESSPVRFFIGNPSAGGIGITLTAAHTVVYYSNSFSLEDRLQSEDRAHRSGLKHTVTYIDLIARDTVDNRILGAFRENKSLADTVTGDAWREWI